MMQMPAPKKPPWGKILGAGCVVALLGSAAIGAFVWFIIQTTAPPRDAGHAFLGHLRTGNIDAAYDATTMSYKARVDRKTFEKEVLKRPQLAASTDATFNNTSISNNWACIHGSLDPSGSIFMALEEDGGTWRIADFDQAPVNACGF